MNGGNPLYERKTFTVPATEGNDKLCKDTGVHHFRANGICLRCGAIRDWPSEESNTVEKL